MIKITNHKIENINIFKVTELTSRQSFFNDLAETWESRFHTQELMTFLEKLVPMFGLRSGQKILDVGTGTGILIPFLLQEVGPSGHIVAIDYAAKMVKVCRSKYGDFSNVSFVVQKIEQIDYPSESFDAVICFGLFPHLENRAEALCQMYRVLKPEGRLIIAHALSSHEIKVYHRSSSLIVAHDTLPKSSEMRQILKQIGFFRISITDKPGCYLCLSCKSSN